MKIYTKAGDKGLTSLVGGKRVPKNHPRVMAYGDMDELISWIGILRSDMACLDEELHRIQCTLMNASAHVAAEDSQKKLPAFPSDDIAWLENRIDEMTAAIPPQKAFVLPCAPREAAECHVARTVCRRCERSITGIESNDGDMEAVARYINRLSDYLFTLARYMTTGQSLNEDFWLP